MTDYEYLVLCTELEKDIDGAWARIGRVRLYCSSVFDHTVQDYDNLVIAQGKITEARVFIRNLRFKVKRKIEREKNGAT